jgi:hypothetical protein
MEYQLNLRIEEGNVGKKIKIDRIFKKYMKPFFEEHGFKSEKMTIREYLFRHKDKKNALIEYQINPVLNSIDTIIYGGIHKITGMIRLTQLINGPEYIDEIIRDEWYFDSKEELLGKLEKQSDLFKEWVFDWMLGNKYTSLNIYEILNKRSNERAMKWESKNFKSYKDKWGKISNSESLKYAYEWQKNRFYPKKWRLDPKDLDDK